MILFKNAVIALWLHEHPNTKVLSNDAKTYFWYDNTTDKFYYTSPENKRKNEIYEARGLAQWYKQGVATWNKI